MSEAESATGRTDAIQALERAVGLLFQQGRRVMAQAAERVSPGMQPGAYKVFGLIASRGAQTASELTEQLQADKGQVSRIVKDLIELNLVQSEPDETDRRARRLSVTPFGATRLEEARAPLNDILEKNLSGWSLGEMNQLTALLTALVSSTRPPRDSDETVPAQG